MPDRIYFPLIFLFAGGLIWLALQSFGNTLPTGSISGANTDYAVIEVEGLQLNRLIAEDEAEVSLIRTETSFILRLQPVDAFFPLSPDAGPHFRLAPDLEVAFSEQPLRITLRARATAEKGAPALEINYLAGPEGTSGWRKFPLTSEFADHTFEFTPPTASQDRGVDFLGIRPSVEGQNGGIEIEKLTFENLAFERSEEETEAPTP